MYDARTRLAAQVADEVRTHFAAETLPTVIPRSVRISEAPSYGQTVLTYHPDSAGAVSYLAGRPARSPAAGAEERRHDHDAPNAAGWAAAWVSCSSGPTSSRSRRPASRIRPRRPAADAAGSEHSVDGASAFPRAPTSPSCRSTAITPNPRQPRTVFDEDAMAELVDSIGEVGLLQPVVVRPLGDGPVRAGDGGAALAGSPAGRPGRPSRRSSGRPRTTSCCATRCWRTCTGPS